MIDLNDVKLIGNLCRDSELKYTQSGVALCKLSLAVNRCYKKGEVWEKETSFFDIEAWGKLAESLNGMAKGQRVLVIGELRQEQWEKDGQKHSKVKIVASAVEKIERYQASEKTAKHFSSTEQITNANHDEFISDIPF